MLKRSVLLFAYVFLIISCTWMTQALPSTAVLNGYFPGRSGDIIISSKSNTDGSFVVFANSNQLTFPENIPETHFADLLSHLMGTPVLNPSISRQGFPKVNIFNKPAANVMFVVNSIPSDASSMSVLSGSKVGISSESISTDTVSRLTTLLSGYTPSVHGIVADYWFDKNSDSIAEAYGTFDSNTARVANLQDLYTLIFSGESMIVSSAATRTLSRALSAKSFVLPSGFANNFGFYWNTKNTGKAFFDSVYVNQSPKLQITSQNVANVISAMKMGESGSCTDILADEAGYDLSVEIAFVELLIHALESNSEFLQLIKDGTPDLFSIEFSGIKSIVSKFGANSRESQCGFQLIDSVITNMMSKVKGLYNGEVLSEVVFLPATTEVRDLSAAAKTAVSDILPARTLACYNGCMRQCYPNIYLRNISMASSMICSDLQASLAATGLEVACMAQIAADSAPFNHIDGVHVVEMTTAVRATPDLAKPNIYQTALWTTIILLIALFATFYYMFSIDPSTDMMLYADDIKFVKFY